MYEEGKMQSRAFGGSINALQYENDRINGYGRRSNMDGFQTEYPFELPRGYVDGTGMVHKKGIMRLATAADEIIPMKDPRVQQNPSYISIILLARVITRLGDLSHIDTRVIENLFTADLAFLQEFYQKINETEPVTIQAVCPHCNEQIQVPWNFEGE